MKIGQYDLKKTIEFTGQNENLKNLENILSKLKDDDNTKIVTNLLIESSTVANMRLLEYEKYLFDELGITNEISAEDIYIVIDSDEKCLMLDITTKDQVVKFISKLCEIFNVNATVESHGTNEILGGAFETLSEITKCYSNGTCQSTVMQYIEYLYRYNAGIFWEEITECVASSLERYSYGEFRTDYPFLNRNDIQFVREWIKEIENN